MSRWPSGSRRARPGSRSRSGSTGDAYDNAVAESLFATLKKELINRRTWPTRKELIGAVFDYVETFDNNRRRHSTLGYLRRRRSNRRGLRVHQRK